MDAISLVGSWCLGQVKELAAHPERIASLIDSVDRVATRNSEEQSKKAEAEKAIRIANIHAQTEQAKIVVGEEEFARLTNALFFEEWLNSSAHISPTDRFSSDICQAALLALRDWGAFSKQAIELACAIDAGTAKSFIIYVKNLAPSAGFQREQIEWLEYYSVFETKDKHSSIENVVNTLLLISLLYGLVAGAVMAGSFIVSFCVFMVGELFISEDLAFSIADKAFDLVVLAFKFLIPIVPVFLPLMWISSTINSNKPRLLTSFGEYIRRLILSIPAR